MKFELKFTTLSNIIHVRFWSKQLLPLILLMIFGCSDAGSQQPKKILSNRIPTGKIVSLKAQKSNTNMDSFVSKDEFQTMLKKLPSAVKEQLLKDGEEADRYKWPSIPVTSYMDYKRKGNRVAMENYYNKRRDVLKKLVLAELLEDKGRFLDNIFNGAWAICEQTSWTTSPHLSLQKGGIGVPNIEEPVITLSTGELANLLSWTFFFFESDMRKVSPFLADRIPFEIKKRVIDPYLDRDDFWWMGFNEDGHIINNWNIWCNYNVLLSVVLLGDDVDYEQRNAVVEKSMRSVDYFIDYFKDDGASEEGPGYWIQAGGRLVSYLEILGHVSGGNINLNSEQIVKNIFTYISKVHIHKNYYVNFADASIKIQHHPAVIYKCGAYINSEELKSLAAYVAKNGSFSKNPMRGSLDQAIDAIRYFETIRNTQVTANNELSFWFEQTEIAGGRTGPNEGSGFFFAAKGGSNNEAHNHNDVGSFILYYNGEPLLVDIGVGTYTNETFSKKRYQIFNVQSDYHNIPIVNGFSQSQGAEYKAKEVKFKNTDDSLVFSVDIGSAYPADAKCRFWNRTYTLVREETPSLEIKNDFSLESIQAPNVEHFISAMSPKLIKPGEIQIATAKNNAVILSYPADKFDMAIDEVDLKDDERLKNDWARDKLYRVALKANQQKSADSYTIKITELVSN